MGQHGERQHGKNMAPIVASGGGRKTKNCNLMLDNRTASVHVL